eukprot:CAMPEP_0114158948 /NCGR_PEP_ID=MMETSP0043_2-20121206/27508_1 /TAXON_ID=464988 /ORGANISM="Hemiselmis andersenii, Strain CCMP644" /LENGTH=44 /DNA_ID= /DNA_START= /DNA_END= /DNA_ORIENTATION=
MPSATEFSTATGWWGGSKGEKDAHTSNPPPSPNPKHSTRKAQLG